MIYVHTHLLHRINIEIDIEIETDTDAPHADLSAHVNPLHINVNMEIEIDIDIDTTNADLSAHELGECIFQLQMHIYGPVKPPRPA
jgi:hypothetical protein